MSKIFSEIYAISNSHELDTQLIEKELENVYDDVIRWAIVDIDDKCIKISVSYKKKS